MWRPCISCHLSMTSYQQLNRVSDFHEIWIQEFLQEAVKEA
jgi:hypothetical protein